MLQGVANRDLKLENLLLTFKEGWARPLLKICDFGYSKVLMLDAVCAHVVLVQAVSEAQTKQYWLPQNTPTLK